MSWAILTVRFDNTITYAGLKGYASVAHLEKDSMTGTLLAAMEEGWEPFYFTEGAPKRYEQTELKPLVLEPRDKMGEYKFKKEEQIKGAS